MSHLDSYRLQAWEKAFWYYAGANYSDAQCSFYAKEFETYALENTAEGVTLDDLLNEFITDVRFAEQADVDKERSRYV